MIKNLKKPVFLGTELVKACIISGFLAFFFYRSMIAFLPMMFPAGLYIWWERRKNDERKNRIFLQQFSECILSVNNSVRSGYAAENAFLESRKDMEMMFGSDAEIVQELALIRRGLSNHFPIEKLLHDMGQRTGLIEVKEFAEIFAIAKQSGGSLADVIGTTSRKITQQIAVEEEIDTILSAKKLEQKIMNLIPFFMVIYLEITTPGYFDMFFDNFSGVVMMTGFLLWYMTAYGMSEYILWRMMKE